MGLRASALVLVAGFSFSLTPLQSAAPKNSEEFFETHIRPLLAKNCFACHTAARMGGLELDSREHLLKGGKDGPVVVPGKPDESVLIQAVRRTHPRFKMPPQGKLTDEEVADLTAWVKAGVVWPETQQTAAPASKPGEYVITPEQRAFWSFQPVRKPPVPAVKESSWPKTDIDRFILAKLEEKGLNPAPPASKRVLIRRVTFDLIGLPPTPNEVDAFLSDSSPDAYAKLVDRLLASPHYGERWGRYWLDLARYADGNLGADKDAPFPNAFRYRDWVIQAFNGDMPYNVFVKAQIAADLLPNNKNLMAGLGFQALGGGADDEVDVTTRTFLGLTVGCARCHNHKYDPIPTQDYYSLLGIFRSSESYQYPLAPENVVAAYKAEESKIAGVKDSIDEFVEKQSGMLGEVLAAKTAQYLVASWKVLGPPKMDVAAAAAGQKLDRETLERWVQYLREPDKDHPYLKPWYALLARNASLEEIQKFADGFQATALAVIADKKGVDDRNYVKLGGAKGVKDEAKRQYANLDFLDVDKYYLWRDLCSESFKKSSKSFNGGIYYYGETEIGRWLAPAWKDYLDTKRAELAALKKALPPHYPFLHVLRDAKDPKNIHVAIRGDASNPGEEAPRRFLAILCNGGRALFTKGSGRLDLADAIASPANPLTARVMVNRIWELHFGHGLVRTPGNFGLLGDRPSHPELLDYLAAHFVETGWSIKTLQREILLSSAYQMSAQYSAKGYEADPENRLLWRANLLPRLDAESLRDSLLAVAGKLDLTVGGPPAPLDDSNHRRTVYAYVGRTHPDPMLALFDFPDPNNTSEHRLVTGGPMQRLFFLNSSFVEADAKSLCERLSHDSGADDASKIKEAYLLLYSRPPTEAEMQLGLEFLRQTKNGWPQYAQVLLSSNEFSSVN